MRVFQRQGQAPPDDPARIQARSTPFYAMWDSVARFAQEIRASDFMVEMIRRRDAYGSSHSYRHMLWVFRQFWPRLRGCGLLVSHDVQMNAAFPEFVTKTYAHDKKTGRRDEQRTSHYEWGRWGYIGFAVKKNRSAS